jgi:hypothetical protein
MRRQLLGMMAWVAMSAVTARAQMVMAHDHPMAKPAVLTAVVDNGDLVFQLGPIDLPAHAMHEDIQQPPPMTVPVGVDGWLHGYTIELTDSAGRVVPQTVVHHVNVIIPQKRELFSPIMLRLAAAGAETAPVGLPWFLGYHVTPADSVLVSAMFHNPTGTGYGKVYLRVRMPMTRRHVIGAMTIFPFYMDVMPPAGSHSFDLPVGRSERYWEGSPAIAGRILGVSGHVHKYGVLLRLEDRTDARILWEGKPTVDEHGEIVAIPVKKFVTTFGVGIEPSHVYRLTVVYENPTGAPVIDGGMGALGGVFKPGDADRWPAVDRVNPEYVLDWRITYRLDTSRDVHGGHEPPG